MMGTYSDIEEDSFFDIRDETGSLSDLGSDFSDACTTRNEISERALGYEFWTRDPESVDERRHRFLKWIGLNLNCDRADGLEPDRIRDDNEAELANSESVNNFFSDRSSKTFEPNEAMELEEDSVENPMYWKIRNLDNGSEFVADELGKDGMLSRLREVEILRDLVRLMIQNESEKFVSKTHCFHRRKERTKGVQSTQRVRVQTSKKESKELSSLYTGQEFLAHEGSIVTMKFSPCGQYLASAGKDGTVRIWRVLEDEISKNFNVQDIDPSSLYFSLNHLSKLAFLNDNREKINGMKMMRKSSESACVVLPPKLFRIMEKPVHEFRGHMGEILALAWSKNGYLLSSSVDKTVRLWQVGHDECLGVYSHNNYVTCVEFNPMNDNYFISGSIDGKIRLWEVHGCRVIDWTDVKEIVTAVCYCPDGKGGVVGYMDGNCCFYDVISVLSINSKNGKTLGIDCAVILGRLLVGGKSYDLKSFRHGFRHMCSLSHYMVEDLAWTPTVQTIGYDVLSSFIASGNRLQMGIQVCLQGKKKLTNKRVAGFQYCPNDSSKVMVTSADSQVRILCGSNIICKFKGIKNLGRQCPASFTSDGKHVVAVTEDSNVYIWKYSNEDGTTSQAKKVRSSESFFSQMHQLPYLGAALKPTQGRHYQEVF
ncbi:hypothetical protein RND71_019049 [Anisodus tanguticus]|uniref:Uncharacterized protein n=1 Tax=Anisodus tanguticus TaxID=243964 RepID=A0AAE1S565_9SOLA|nr:hypothetical protein RND71_019049 [Anisodus tanguticus]